MTPIEHFEASLRHLRKVEESLMLDEDYLTACRSLGRLAENYQELAADCAQRAFDEGATKKDIATALGLAPSALRGMQKTTGVAR